MSEFGRLNLRVPHAWKSLLQMWAEGSGVTREQLIRVILQDWIQAREYEVLQKSLEEKDKKLQNNMELHRDVLILTRANYQLAKDFKAQWHGKVSWWHWLRNLFRLRISDSGGL